MVEFKNFISSAGNNAEVQDLLVLLVNRLIPDFGPTLVRSFYPVLQTTLSSNDKGKLCANSLGTARMTWRSRVMHDGIINKALLASTRFKNSENFLT